MLRVIVHDAASLHAMGPNPSVNRVSGTFHSLISFGQIMAYIRGMGTVDFEQNTIYI